MILLCSADCLTLIGSLRFVNYSFRLVRRGCLVQATYKKYSTVSNKDHVFVLTYFDKVDGLNKNLSLNNKAYGIRQCQSLAFLRSYLQSIGWEALSTRIEERHAHQRFFASPLIESLNMNVTLPNLRLCNTSGGTLQFLSPVSRRYMTMEMANIWLWSQTLDCARPSLNEEQRQSIVKEFTVYIEQLRGLIPPKEGAVGSTKMCAGYDHRLGHCRFGPFDSISDFHNYVRRGEPLKFWDEAVSLVHKRSSSYTTKYCHADLCPNNVLVKDGKIVAIIGSNHYNRNLSYSVICSHYPRKYVWPRCRESTMEEFVEIVTFYDCLPVTWQGKQYKHRQILLWMNIHLVISPYNPHIDLYVGDSPTRTIYDSSQ
ncbi:uncharacterized protein MCYG_02064 [Microsporum canis CBS 113480]|uniref:Aminoglycoside phosphotransferase domain-containing protein n=1 Tax=Arthroderma otae (strain ATCC MYA-4605 / CBS 113480) TaxID=554155 RepID=C5FIH6_ARTOC|nr:uncharacterized protein MCYG_02064 [Microsporum canis CBS 113480]EEQ29245.1 hypothetical protein MCYG_02064 [Microsporum canis CBS 113480]